MKKTKVMIAAATLILLLAAVAGFGSGQQGQTAQPKKIELMTFGSWGNRVGVVALLDYVNANSAQLGATVEVNKLPEGSQGTQLLQARLASNDHPDILYAHNLSEMGQWVPNIDKVFTPVDDGEWKKLYEPDFLNSVYCTFNGKIYCAPLGDVAIYSVYYNKKIFKELGVEVPKTFSAFLDVLKKAQAKGYNPYAIAGKDGWPITIAIPGGFQRDYKPGFGAKEMTEALNTNKYHFADSPAMREMFEKLAVIAPYLSKTWLTDTYGMCQQYLMEGKAAMFPMGTFADGDLAALNAEMFKNDIGYMAFPYDKDTYGTIMPPQPALYVPAQAKNPKLAQKVIQFMEKLDSQAVYYKAQPGIPFAKGVKSEVVGPVVEQLDIFRNQANKNPNPPSKYGVDIGTIMTKVAMGSLTADQALVECDKALAAVAKAKADPNW